MSSRVRHSNRGGVLASSPEKSPPGRVLVRAIALYGSELNRLALVAPEREVNLDVTQPIAAAVGPDGALHLTGVVSPNDTSEVHYWHLNAP